MDYYSQKWVMWCFCLCIIIFSSACGGPVTVEIHHTEQNYIDSICDEDYRCEAYAKWDGIGNCDIYIKDRAEYINDDEYHRLLGHELRHCFEGEFH